MLENEQNTTPSILIVDDNSANLEVLGGFLQKEGMDLEFALDGSTALKWLDIKVFDLILLDIMMPIMDGFEVCSLIKGNPSYRGIPIIFITAKTDSESIVRGFKSGAVDYITKPFIQSELLARVKTHLDIIKSKQNIIGYLNKIEEKNENINSSIRYARNIQKAILNTTKLSLRDLPEHFILNSPKDILSGDFYWINNVEGRVIFAVMDCTGHGVPGALMSILGTTLLNEIIIQENILQPEKILESLRNKLILSLGQDKETINVKDSIEGSIINYNPDSGILLFAGTHNPLIQIADNEIKKRKADRIPIGFYENPSPFTLNSLYIKKGDLVYLFSDGIIDQIGGPDAKRISSKRFSELLYEFHDLPLETQKIKLSEYLISWKGEIEQTDDILVLGIKF